MSSKRVADSEITFSRAMNAFDANRVGNVHGGVIMREVDVAAGTCAARHDETVCVTAAIDELSFLQPVFLGDLLFVHARVNDVGKTSLEVGVRVEAEPWQGGERRHTTSAYLVMVAIDAEGNTVGVPELVDETDDEQRRRSQARVRREVLKERIDRLGVYGPEPADE
jgi:acyl-CoA hydrolase